MHLLDSIRKSVTNNSRQNQKDNQNKRRMQITLKQRFVHEEGPESVSELWRI